MHKGEIRQFSVNFNPAATRLGTSVSSHDWTTSDGAVGLGTETLTSNVSYCMITASKSGCAMVKCTATMADTQKVIKLIKITVDDPYCIGGGSDY